MSEVVWVSHAMKDSSLTKALTSERLEEDKGHALEILRKNKIGAPLRAKDMPKKLFPQSREPHVIKRLPQLFYGGGHYVMSEKAADILRQFDLGDGGLHPIKIFQKDLKTEFGEGWHCINFGNVKETCVLEKSLVGRGIGGMTPGPEVRVSEGVYETKYYNLPFVAKDDVVAVSRDALGGPDIWMDPLVHSAFFISERLARALKKAKLDKAFRLFKCRVVEFFGASAAPEANGAILEKAVSASD